MITRLGAAAAIGLAALAGAGCESTQSKSERLARGAKGAARGGKGLVVTKRSRDIRVERTAVLQDENGSAAVVDLRNGSKRALAAVPIAIDVLGSGRRSLYRNDAPGLEESLVGASVLGPGERLSWINDQVTADGRPRRVRARVGADAKPVTGQIPRIEVSGARLESDPTSGVAAVGKVRNASKVMQRKLVVYAVARKGGRVVAAGRGQVARVPPGRRAGFSVFFIGDPRGARLELAAPPTVLR